MRPLRFRWLLPVILLACFAAPVCAQTDPHAGPLRFRITLAPSLGNAPISGRLFVLMTAAPAPPAVLHTGFIPGATWLAAREIVSWAPGQTVTLDPDALAYPRPFSQAKPGTYHVMALLDRDHNYGYADQDGDDLYGPVVSLANLDPVHVLPVVLTIDRQTPARPAPADTPSIRTVEFPSPLLSAFWGRPITLHAGVVLPPDYDADPKRTYPTVYHVHGFGGDYRGAWAAGPALIRGMQGGTRARMVHVFLDASFSTGHTVFADSVNNGPWGRALTQEFIPFLEKTFRLTPRPAARFLTGHSSGGWSTLWLQVTYPDFFGGAWSTSPDPVDLRSWTGVDVTPGSTDNVYRTRDGRPRNLVRRNGQNLATLEAFARQEQVQGDYGGQFASFEYVWSPRGLDGRPMPLFNRETGTQDPVVQRAWTRYDIRLQLAQHWATLGPKLLGKIHIFVGDQDTFHLEEGVKLLRAFFQQVGSDSEVEIIPGRDHFTLYSPYTTYPKGLSARIDDEMRAALKAHGL